MASPMEQQSQRSNTAKPLSQLKTIEDLSRKMDALKQHRLPLEKQWKLNLAFYKGHQYSFYPPKSNRLESLTVDDGLKPRHRIRLVSNQIMPGSHTLLAQLTKTKPRIYATPGSGAENEARAAQMAQSLLEYWWQDLALDEKLDEALLWSIIASAGYWKITWDKFAAKQMRFILDPNGQPITDDSIKSEYTAQLAKFKQEPQEKIVYLGDVNIDVMSPFDVYLDPGAKIFEESKFAICCHNLDPDEIKSRWGVKLEPDATPTTPDQSVPYANSPSAQALTVRKIYIGYFKPTAAMPNGRYVVFTEGADKAIIADEKWPFPHNDLPLVKFPGMRVPGSVYDDAVVTHAVPLQKELNRTISQIVEYKNMTINPVMVAPVGSLRTRRTTEPGQVLEYTPVGAGLKPEFENLPTLPPYVFEHLKDISSRLETIFLSAEVVQGKVPPNVEAGIAIDLLQEMATDKLAPVIKLMELSLSRAGQQMLGLAQKFYVEPRLMKIRGSGGSTQVKQFVNADINGNITFHTETGSGLPRTRAGKQARIEKFVELGIVPPEKAVKYFDIGDLKALQANMEADEDFAYRNIDKIIQGIPVNPEAVQQAMSFVNQGINPTTQQPLQNPQEAQQVLQNASLTPPTGIDFDTHLDITGLFMKGMEFEKLEPNIRQNFITYWQNILQTKFSIMPLPQPEPARVTYNIRGTAGPTAASKILTRAGINATPQDLSEPPLETWITDSVDKPDTDAAGPGEEANQLSEAAQGMMQVSIADAESKHQAAIKSQQHSMDMSGEAQKQIQDAHVHGATQQQQAELHGQKLREATAKAALAEKKLKQSDFKKTAPKKAAKK